MPMQHFAPVCEDLLSVRDELLAQLAAHALRPRGGDREAGYIDGLTDALAVVLDTGPEAVRQQLGTYLASLDSAHPELALAR